MKKGPTAKRILQYELPLRASAFGLLLASSTAMFAQAQGSDVRAQLASIGYRNVKTVQEYLVKCEKVKALLPRLDAFYRQSAATIARIRAQSQNKPDVVRMADFYSEMNKKDVEGFVLIREEMGLASRLARLSPQRQNHFFDNEILPLEYKEDQIIEQEMQMAVKARNEGIPLPEDVSAAISNRK